MQDPSYNKVVKKFPGSKAIQSGSQWALTVR